MSDQSTTATPLRQFRSDIPHSRVDSLDLPLKVVDALHEFFLDRATGNVTLNIKDGRVLGFHVERIVSL